METRSLVKALWRSRTGPILIAVQIAIALAVLVNIAYIVAGRIETYRRPTGIDVHNIFWVTSQGFATDYDQSLAVRTDLAYLNGLPGVIAAAASATLPQGIGGIGLPFASTPEDLRAPKAGGAVLLMTDRGLDALGVKLIAGRAPHADDTSAPADMMSAIGRWAPEVAITSLLAHKLFPRGDALGRTLYAGLINRPAKIVGIVERMQTQPVSGPFSDFAESVVFVPGVPAGPSALYIVRTQPGRRAEVMAEVERSLADKVPGRYIEHMETLDQTASNTRNWLRSSSIILGAVALLVLAVTAIGIFGLAAFNVATRTRQIGTRRAVGARRHQILKYFLLENWLITTAGVVVGCILALALGARLSVMFQLPRLPLYYLAVGVVALWLLGLGATLMPARKASSVAPAIATRTV
ncbi:MAG TPA: FtsX-like permease family protein [Steroidobacteraceae bacterium]|nr:FtsX-like permease family protein [Steroidobacteraceae bacterium]